MAVPASAGAAVPAALVEAMRQSGTKMLRTHLGIFRIAEATLQTYITCQAPGNEKPRLVLAVTTKMYHFHRDIGWELFG